MRRGLLGSLLGCMVGGLTAAHLQEELGARGPHLQRDDAPLLYPRFRAISARLGMALAGHLAGHPLQAGDGHFAGLGRRPTCRPRELGGPVARALGPHTRPPQAGRDAILAGRRPLGSAGNIRGLGLHTCWRSGPLAGGRRFAGAFRHHRRGATHQSCSSKERATLNAVSFNPWIGVRVGEATQPGPAGQPPSSPRARAIAALQHIGLGRISATDNAWDVETVSDTLSVHTPLASPPGTPRSAADTGPHDRAGDIAPTAADEATLGYSPTQAAPATPPLPRWREYALPAGERQSWLYVPLLHAGAAGLGAEADRAWREHPQAGPRWEELVAALRGSRPIAPSALARLYRAIAELEAGDAQASVSPRDQACLAAVTLLPDAPISLPEAAITCADPDGYISAAAQSALLEGFGGVAVAAAANSLAADMRSAFELGPPVCPPRAGPGRRRRRRQVRRGRHDQPDASDQDAPAAADGEPALQSDVSQSRTPHSRAWERLDAIDLAAEFRRPVPTLQDVPPFLRAAVRHALMLALRELRTAYEAGTDHSYTATERAWKLFLLAPRMLLARPAHRQGPRGREELLARAAAFERGEWTSLLENARQLPVPTESPPKSDEVLAAERRERACAKVRIGEVSRARQVLTAAELAPGTEDTFHALTDPERRPPAARTPIPPHDPLDPVQLSAWAVATALREARRGGAPGLSGMRAEHLKLLLQDMSNPRNCWPTPPLASHARNCLPQ